ncbi:putative bifunctional diguanylate cyclase/phosphodiesterase [Amphibiibacter pelophylacis]|uniref:EAL domain-containing protein n=1 Tax=Amphibiibacter pelophylacis TaxID=1799477 RepID=A0ACC6P393_9BURK
MEAAGAITANPDWPWLLAAVAVCGLGTRLFAHAIMHIQARPHWRALVGWAVVAISMINVSTLLAHTLVVQTLQLPWPQGLSGERTLEMTLISLGLSLLSVVLAWVMGFQGPRALIYGVVCGTFWVLVLAQSVSALHTPPLHWLEWQERLTFLTWTLVPLWLGTAACAAVFSLRFEAQRLRRLRPLLGALVFMAGVAPAYWLGLRSLEFPAQGLPIAPGMVITDSQWLEHLIAGLITLGVGAAFVWVERNDRRQMRQAQGTLEEMKQYIKRQAYTDSLTFMPNRLQLEETLSRAQARVGRDPGALAVLFIDLDGFKPINDTYGHVDGDTVLREVGKRLAALATERQMVARIGGDEFLMMMEQPHSSTVVAQMASRINAVLREPYLLPNNIAVNLTSSVGIAMFPDHCTTDRLISHADAAKFAAKRMGGNTYIFYDPSMNLADEEMMALQSELRVAVERGELMLHYQPKIDARTGKIRGVEALVRWNSPTRGMVSPGKFIPVAERFGIIIDVGNWVINEACRQTREWMTQGMRLKVAINLSVFQLRMDNLVDYIDAAMKRYEIEPSLLIFEVTESAAMEDPKATRGKLKAIKRLGVSLSIDDFGTGYSSLSYLRQLPFQQLKVDRSFVIELDRDQRDEVSSFEENQKQNNDALAIVDAIVRLSHALNYRVVAEGVETERQKEILMGLNVDEFQGFLFSKPLSPAMLALWAMGEDGNILDDFPPTQAFVPSGFFFEETR